MVQDINNIPALLANLAPFNGIEGVVGVFGSNASQPVGGIDMGTLAVIHQNGLRIEVTEKMRGFLHSVGLHLRDDTQFIHIPPRPYLDVGVDAAEMMIKTAWDFAFPLLIENRMSANEFMDIALVIMESEVLNVIEEGDGPAPELHPFTEQRKNSSHRLVDSGGLKNSISRTIRLRGGA